MADTPGKPRPTPAASRKSSRAAAKAPAATTASAPSDEPFDENERPEEESDDDLLLAGESEESSEGDNSDETAGAIVPAAALRAEGLGPADLLQRYMTEVGRYPLLTREEELALSREYQQTGDPQLAYRLVTANLRLVVKIAWDYRRAAFNLLDLIQEGNIGLMQAVKKFDPERGVKLSTYAAWWIRAYVIRYLMDNWRMVKLGTTQAQRKLFFNLNKEKEKLAREGFVPSPKLLSERLQVPEQDVVDMDHRLSTDDLSLDAPLSGDSSLSYGDRLTESTVDIDDRLAEDQIARSFREKLADFAQTLADRERFIFERRLVADDPLTLQQIGEHYGVSRERARQIEARLTARLKEYMREHLPDFAQLSLEPDEDR